MSIYTDVAAIESAIDSIIESADEWNSDVESALTNLMAAKNDTIVGGIERLAKVRANKQATVAGIDAEIKRLTDRRARINKSVEWFENYIYSLLKASGQPKLECGLFKVSTRLSKSVWLAPDFSNEKYMRTKTITEPDKIAIRDALKNGEQIDGAHLTEKENIQIK